MATFNLTDGTVIADVTTYSIVRPENTRGVDFRAWLDTQGPVYTVFTADGGHRYVAVKNVAEIVQRNRANRIGSAWYDLPIAAGMWAADGADLGA